MLRKETEAWIVLKVGQPRDDCGHRQSQLVAICGPVGEKSGEEVAKSFCSDHTNLIGPVPLNTLLPETPFFEWPGSYFPLAQTEA
jgi:hypothetical protein